jgi:hypothetical protein
MVTFDQQLTASMTVDVFSHYDSFLMVGPDGLVNVVIKYRATTCRAHTAR